MATIDERIRHLDALAGHLAEAGLTAGVQRTGEPCLAVSSAAFPGVTEKILCILGDDDSLWFAWPWRKMIASVTEPARAAMVVADVFRPVLGECG